MRCVLNSLCFSEGPIMAINGYFLRAFDYYLEKNNHISISQTQKLNRVGVFQ